MGVTKTESFTRQQNDIAMLTKALAHPARIAILEFLLKTDSCITGEIVENLPLAQATVSQHLKELKNAGLIKGTVEGTSVCYCINRKKWNDMQEVLNSFFAQKSENNCC